MRLLVIAQAVDRRNAVMGFFHSWLECFSRKFESIVAVGLQTGDYELPSNVKVLSLGKEESASSLKYILRFLRILWRERNSYDAVFVHMTPIYIILAGWFWKLKGKKILLWYNHQHGNLLDKIGILLADKALHTSPFSFCARFQHAERMPAGIDTDLFTKSSSTTKISGSILSLGRVSPVKKLHRLVEALSLLKTKETSFVLDMVGSPITAGDRDYDETLKASASALTAEGRVRFVSEVPNETTPNIYNQHELFVNLSPAGLFDKTILEAMACETLVLITNPSFSGSIPEELILENDEADRLAGRITDILKLPEAKKLSYGRELRNYVLENHRIQYVVDKISQML